MKKRITYALLFAAVVFTLCTAQSCSKPYIMESAPTSVGQSL